MKKIIAIGECGLRVMFRDSRPWASVPAGAVLNAAVSLGNRRHTVDFVGEASADHVGDILAGFLTAHNVATRSVDRFTEGRSPVTLVFTGSHGNVRHMVRYENYSPQSFDVVWPRVDEGDVLLFGGLYALSERVRQRLYDLVKNARERGALILYAPAIDDDRTPRLTHIKPAMLDNMELAHVVVTLDDDLQRAFNQSDAAQAYRHHVSFSCFNHINIDAAGGTVSFRTRRRCEEASPAVASTLPESFGPGALAGVASALAAAGVNVADLEEPSDELMKAVVATAQEWGTAAAAAPDGLVPPM